MRSLLAALFVCLMLPAATALRARTAQLKNLSYSNPHLKQLRREIGQNLRSVARGRGLAHPLRVLRYEVRANDNFFVIMARVSQDLDTLVSLNGIANPNALKEGQVLLIPNARGRFVPRKHPILQSLRLRHTSLPVVNGLYFLPGERMPLAERRYFRGEGFLQPLPRKLSRISSRFGRRRDPFRNVLTFHGGLDMAAPAGTPVYASRKGRVIRAENGVSGYGKLIVIQHRFGYTSWYGHLKKILVKKGDTIQAGEKIGLVGSTGRATGPHLHFEIRKNGHKRNPLGLLKNH